MTIPEQIYELVKSLPQEQASEVLDFAEFIRAKSLNANQSNDIDAPLSWEELVKSLAGSWGDDFPSLEEIRANQFALN
jgi:hypothetical protein